MLFNSFAFFAFLLISLGLYQCCPARWRTALLTVLSWYFYSFWSVRFLGLIVLSTVVDYVLALLIERSENRRARQACLWCSVVVNLGILALFKYCNFFLESLVTVAAAVGWTISPLMLHVVLPVGISFYTFQTMGYTIDVYRGTCRARRGFFDVACYVAFFPQLVAGPIERAERLLPQLERLPRLRLSRWGAAFPLIVWGLFKKVVIADNLAPLVDDVFDPGSQSPENCLAALVGVYAFAVQIYADFSGYSDIARGVARLFGVELMLNFNLPYLARSMRDFWRRWHISLSTWLRDYLYVPLGGSHGTHPATAVNLLVTMLLGGLWHGASWMFLLWGAYHGLLLAAENAMSRRRGSAVNGAALAAAAWWTTFCKTFLVFHLVCLGWVFFRAPDVSALAHWLGMFAGTTGWSESWRMCIYFLWYAAPLVVVWLAARIDDDGDEIFARLPWPAQATYAALLYFGLTLLSADSERSFIYFQF